MTDTAQFVVPEGWYPDPAGALALRWWDGASWTEHMLTDTPNAGPQGPAEARTREGRHSAPTGATTSSAISKPTESADLPSRRQLRAQWNAVSARELGPEIPTSTAPAPLPETHPTFFTSPHVARVELSGAHTRPHDDGVPLAPLTAAALEAFMAKAEAELQLSRQSERVAEIEGAAAVQPQPAPSNASAVTLTPPKLSADALPAPTFEPTAVHETLPPAADEFTSSRPNAGQSALSQLTAVPERGTFVPFATEAPWRTQQADRPDIVNTLSAWMLALIPVLYPLTMVLVVFALDVYIPAVQLGIAAIFVLWMVVLAMRDARELRASRHEKVASPAWILLSPLAYLIARGVTVKRQTGRGFGPLILFGIATASEFAFVLAAPAFLTFWK